MYPQRSLRLACLLIGAIACLPLVASAASVAERDYADASRLKPDLRNGARLFESCAACHGGDGQGNDDDGVPRIAGQFPQIIIRQLVDYRHEKRIDSQMQAVADRHQWQGARDLADVAAYAAGLRTAQPAQTGRGEYLEAGARLYAARCAGCHGASGQGDGKDPVPRLAGQHYRYLLRQFHDALDGRRPQLGRSHGRILEDLDREGLQGLADLLSRMDASPEEPRAGR